jgi:hypothetical protein
VNGRNGSDAGRTGSGERDERSVLENLLECVDDHDGGDGLEGAGIDSGPESWKSGEGKLADEVIKAEKARQLFDARNAVRAVTCAQLRQELYKAGSHDVIGPHGPSRHVRRAAIDWLIWGSSGANLVQAPANNLQQHHHDALHLHLHQRRYLRASVLLRALPEAGGAGKLGGLNGAVPCHANVRMAS